MQLLPSWFQHFLSECWHTWKKFDYLEAIMPIRPYPDALPEPAEASLPSPILDYDM